jgi:2-keto-4-pentenoate hydratase/2-oxohepta-3-ene-1,7-dioic acid hydratase in catechol pathway
MVEPKAESMGNSRRSFLQKAALAGAGGLAANIQGKTAAAEGHAERASFEMPRGLTLLTLHQDGEYRIGVKTPGGVLDVRAAAARFKLPVPASIDDLLQNGKGGWLKRLVDTAAASPDGKRFTLPEEGLEYGPVVMKPEKIIMMGFNYRQHAIETHTPIPPHPVLFNKYNNALNCHNGTIQLPTRVATEFDYEVELVIVFGKEAHNVTEVNALDCVAGYCTGNDFSARDLQTLTSQYMIGKTCDGFAPIGPYLVSADLVGDPNDLRLETRVNGEQRQDWNTRDMIFNCRQIISFASSVMTIRPGDILFTGTPQGVIMGKPKDKQVWFKKGDHIACSIEKLGELKFVLA